MIGIYRKKINGVFIFIGIFNSEISYSYRI